MSDTNEYEERNRASKVYALVRKCEQWGWTVEDAEQYNDQQWGWLAGLAEVNPPSDRTKAIVLHVLRERVNG